MIQYNNIVSLCYLCYWVNENPQSYNIMENQHNRIILLLELVKTIKILLLFW